jgi:hypothetical protein
MAHPRSQQYLDPRFNGAARLPANLADGQDLNWIEQLLEGTDHDSGRGRHVSNLPTPIAKCYR